MMKSQKSCTRRYMNFHVLQVGRHCAIWRHQNNPAFRPNICMNLNEPRKAIILTTSNRIFIVVLNTDDSLKGLHKKNILTILIKD